MAVTFNTNLPNLSATNAQNNSQVTRFEVAPPEKHLNINPGGNSPDAIVNISQQARQAFANPQTANTDTNMQVQAGGQALKSIATSTSITKLLNETNNQQIKLLDAFK